MTKIKYCRICGKDTEHYVIGWRKLQNGKTKYMLKCPCGRVATVTEMRNYVLGEKEKKQYRNNLKQAIGEEPEA